MSQSTVESLIDRWINDPAFREQLRVDPEGTVRAAGVELTEDEWAAFRSVDWSQSDEELQSRVSRAAG